MDLWDQITKEELERLYYSENLSDARIAERYGVTKNQVRYKRQKFGVTLVNHIYDLFVEENPEIFDDLNKKSKERLCQPENIDGLAKALTHYIFRNGPVEDMHSDGKLSQEDMKTLNQFMVNRIAGVLLYISEGKWTQLELLYSHLSRFYGADWDKAEPDTEEIETFWNKTKDQIKEQIKES